MTTESIQVELTKDEVEILNSVLGECAESYEVEAIRQKIALLVLPETSNPLEKVKLSVDAVTEADSRVTQLIEQRRQAIMAALDAGYTQQAVADYIQRSQPRIAQMLKRGKG